MKSEGKRRETSGDVCYDPTFDRRFTMNENLENINPKLYKKIDEREITAEELDEDVTDEFDAREIFGTYNLTSN